MRVSTPDGTINGHENIDLIVKNIDNYFSNEDNIVIILFLLFLIFILFYFF